MLENIRSLYKKIDQLQILVKSLDSLPLAVCLTETWMDEEHDTSCLQLDGYQKIVTVSRNIKKKRRGGIVSIFWKTKWGLKQ